MCGGSSSQASHLSWICTVTLLPLGAVTTYCVPQMGAPFGLGPPPNSAYLRTRYIGAIKTIDFGIASCSGHELKHAPFLQEIETCTHASSSSS